MTETPISADPPDQTRAARRYVAGLLAAIALSMAGFAGFGLWLGPPEGDLVRISGASQRAFGALAEQRAPAETRHRQEGWRALLDGADPGGILVFGDSFSTPWADGTSWLETLAADTGHEVVRVPLGDFRRVMRYLRSDARKAAPPAAILVQSVERELAPRARALGGRADCAPVPSPAPIAPEPRSGPNPGSGAGNMAETRPFHRRMAFGGVGELFSRATLAARQRLFGTGTVREVTLTRRDLFSHRAADRLLLLENDIRLHLPEKIAPEGAEAAGRGVLCGLRRMARMADGAGQPLWLMVAPDKRTVYGPWIETPLPEKGLDLFALADEALGPRLIRLDRIMGTAAGETPDLYWPDDSHWGPAGNRLAGQTAARALTGEQ